VSRNQDGMKAEGLRAEECSCRTSRSGFSFRVLCVPWTSCKQTKSLTQRRKDAKDSDDPKSSRWQSRAIVFVIFASFAPLREASFLASPITLRGLASVERKSSRAENILTDCSAEKMAQAALTANDITIA
jgi:hypothetical protein